MRSIKSKPVIKVSKTIEEPLVGIELLISDVNEYLDNHITIQGFSRIRLEELLYNRFITIQNYEWRLLIKWKGIYIYEFENLYNIILSIE